MVKKDYITGRKGLAIDKYCKPFLTERKGISKENEEH